MMEKQNIDWANIGFGYMPIGERFVANYKDGKWDSRHHNYYQRMCRRFAVCSDLL